LPSGALQPPFFAPPLRPPRGAGGGRRLGACGGPPSAFSRGPCLG
jgi:hypothetical protein